MLIAATHVTGESIFVDDIPKMSNELYVSYIGSPVAAGVLKNIHFSKALKIPGVVAVYTAKDLYHNNWGTIKKDQPLLVDKEIGYKDEPLCVVAAESKEVFEEARKVIEFEIQAKKPVLTLDEAIQSEQFLYHPNPFVTGSVKMAFEGAPHTLSGVFEIGGQEHFYLESQASVAYPDDANQIKVISSSQHPTETQHVVAEALGLPFHYVVCEVKRMGGAFGGKESQAAPFAAMAALVAYKQNRPAKIILSKDDDMKVTGKRHPFKNFYEVAFNSDGRILGLKLKLYADGGAYTDLSPSILDRAMFHADGSYYIENMSVDGWVCKTNTHSNTAFRGFGGPQGNMTIESIIEDIAVYLKKDSCEIRRLNCYGKNENNITHYGQKVENNLLPDLFDRIIASSDYKKRRQEINLFNKQQSSKIKGLSLTACKFGISFTAKFLNQGNALVNIHRDGTIQVSTGATEMGQGVNVKIQTVVSEFFGLPLEHVQVMTTSTEKNANTSPTAASSGADINTAAALEACKKIMFRLKQVALFSFSGEKLKGSEEIEIDSDFESEKFAMEFKKNQITYQSKSLLWHDLVHQAYMNRISLSDYGHYKTDGLDFDRATAKGNAFKYFTTGVAVSEVLIDRYTGELKVLRSDLLMDLGRPIHKEIDLGQVSGGFIQGVGWVTTEKLYYNAEGGLVSHSPTTYKIPNIQDIPRVFNFDILENDLNKKNTVGGAKAVGEPPLLLGASVFMAAKNALSYRAHEGKVQLNSPATSEEILMELEKYEF